MSQLMCQDAVLICTLGMTIRRTALQASSLCLRHSDCVKECGDDNWIELGASTTLNFLYNVRDGHG